MVGLDMRLWTTVISPAPSRVGSPSGNRLLAAVAARRAARRRWVDATLREAGIDATAAELAPSNVANGSVRSRWAAWSSSGDVVILVAADKPVAIDIEAVRPVDLNTGIVERFFVTAERASIESAADPVDAFWRAWTRKEAALKLLRAGLRIDPSRLEFDTEADTRGAAAIKLDGRPSGICCQTSSPVPGCAVAVAWWAA